MGFDSLLCYKIRKVEEFINKKSPNIKYLHTAQERLRSAWEKYEASQQVVLTFLIRDQVEIESEVFKKKHVIALVEAVRLPIREKTVLPSPSIAIGLLAKLFSVVL